MEFGIILLAAGASSRMGGEHKLLLPWGDGTVVGQALRNAMAAAAGPVVVVLGCRADEVQAAAKAGVNPNQTAAVPTSVPSQVTWVVNPDWAQGMYTSVMAGLSHLPETVAAFFVALGDMPLIPPKAYSELMVAYRPGLICLPTYEGRRGHPVLVPRDLATGAAPADSDQGLRTVLRRYPERVVEVPLPYPGICIDLDTPEEYQRYHVQNT